MLAGASSQFKSVTAIGYTNTFDVQLGTITADGSGNAQMKAALSPSTLTQNTYLLSVFDLVTMADIELLYQPTTGLASPGVIALAFDYAYASAESLDYAAVVRMFGAAMTPAVLPTAIKFRHGMVIEGPVSSAAATSSFCPTTALGFRVAGQNLTPSVTQGTVIARIKVRYTAPK